MFLWEEGLQGGKATPNLSHRGYLPGTVTCVGAKGDGQAGEDLGTDGVGLRRRASLTPRSPAGEGKLDPNARSRAGPGRQCLARLSSRQTALGSHLGVPGEKSKMGCRDFGAFCCRGCSCLPRSYLRASRSGSARWGQTKYRKR